VKIEVLQSFNNRKINTSYAAQTPPAYEVSQCWTHFQTNLNSCSIKSIFCLLKHLSQHLSMNGDKSV